MSDGIQNSCIVHPAGARNVIVREDYLIVCDGADNPRCAAALLSIFEHWTNYKLGKFDRDSRRAAEAAQHGVAMDTDELLWIYMPQTDLHGVELLGLFGEKAVGTAVDSLIKLGFIERRTNPKHTWDRTYQYRLLIEPLQAAIDKQCPSKLRKASRKIAQSKSAKLRDGTRKSAEAIPQESTQESSHSSRSADAPIDTKKVRDAGIVAIIEAWKDTTKNLDPNPYANKTIRAGAGALVDAGLTASDVTDFLHDMLHNDDYWKGRYSLPFKVIVSDIGAWREANPGYRSPIAVIEQPTAVDSDGPEISDEELARRRVEVEAKLKNRDLQSVLGKRAGGAS